MVKLTIITKEVALTAPLSELPPLARKVVQDEIRALAKGTPREAEVREWLSLWPARDEALALLAELKAEARAEAKRHLPAQPLAVTLKANTQSNQRALERAEEELARVRAERDREQYRSIAELVNFQAIEQGYAQQRWEALASRRYDPTGNWGAPNYKTNADD
jgi:hypothetical protein